VILGVTLGGFASDGDEVVGTEILIEDEEELIIVGFDGGRVADLAIIGE
jgi:hypothetical protein